MDTKDAQGSASGGPKSKSGQQSEKSSSESQADRTSWSLEADRVALHSPLIECLRLMAGHYGRRTSSAALTAGLPIPAEGVSPALFIRAAQRADMHASLVERNLSSLKKTVNLPCILMLEDGQACILWDIKTKSSEANRKPDKKSSAKTAFIVQFPETESERQALGTEQLKRLTTGYAFFLRPVARMDERAGPARIDTARDWFWGALKENMHIYREVILAAVLINLFALASPLFIMNVYDRVIPNSAYETLWVLAAGVLTVFIFDFILKNLRAQFLDVAGRKADLRISARLFEQVLGMTMASRPSSAGVLSSHMREFETLRDFFTSATMVTLIDLPFVLLFIALIGIIGGPLAIVPAVAVPVVVLAGVLSRGPMQRIIRQSMNESALKNALLFETISGLETIKVQAAEGHTQHRWEELTDKAARTSVEARKISNLIMNFTSFIQQLTSVIVVIAGVYLITNGDLSMGALIACVILSSRAMAPLGQVAGVLNRLNQSREALSQLNDLMQKEVERPVSKHFISMPAPRGHIAFKDVVFHYPGQNIPALSHISFQIQPGDKVGIIGAVGSGKTTLERLLLNLYQPDSGSVQLDGSDVRQIDPGDLRRNVGTVQQKPQLFYGTVRENITLGHEMAPERAVLQAAEMAGVMEFLGNTQNGLDTHVGERGESLSGGQQQAVAVARALLYDPPVMILDEPTASMDPASENRLLKRLQKLCADKTTILITHKGPMLALVNKIILIDRGRLVDYGPKDEIIEKLQSRKYGTQAEATGE